MTSRRVTRSQSKAKTLPFDALPTAPKRVIRSPRKAATLPLRRQKDEEEDDEVAEEEEEAPLDQSSDQEENGDDRDNEEEEGNDKEERLHRKPLKPGKVDGFLSPPPSSRSLFSSVLSFVYYIIKWTLIITLLSSLALPLLYLMLSSTDSPLPSPLGPTLDNVISSLRSPFTSPSPSAISSRIHDSLPPMIAQLSQTDPLFRSALSRIIHPLLAEHFNPYHTLPSQPLVLFIATIPIPPSPSSPPTPSPPAAYSFATHLASHLYPPSIPSYYLDLTPHTSQPHFDGPTLSSLLSSHFQGREDGLVFLPSLTSLTDRRGVGRVMQRWADDSQAERRRAVWVVEGRMTEEEMKRTGWDGKKGGEAQAVKRVMRNKMKESEKEHGDDQLIDAMLERIVRNVVVIREKTA